MERKILLPERLFYVALLLLGAVWVGLSESGVVPADYMAYSPKTVYYLDLLSVVGSLGSVYVALRFFAFKRVAHMLVKPAAPDAWRTYRAGCWSRMGLLGLFIAFNVGYYYASSYTTTPGYCLLICLVGWLFCWPSAGEYVRLRERPIH